VSWEKYWQSEPDAPGAAGSAICSAFWRLSPVMHRHYAARDNVVASGLLSSSPGTAIVLATHIFVGVLGAYAEASFTQTLSHWVSAHVSIFRFFGDVPPQMNAHVIVVSGWAGGICSSASSGRHCGSAGRNIMNIAEWRRVGKRRARRLRGLYRRRATRTVCVRVRRRAMHCGRRRAAS
jgi:hypothetical protein